MMTAGTCRLESNSRIFDRIDASPFGVKVDFGVTNRILPPHFISSHSQRQRVRRDVHPFIRPPTNLLSHGNRIGDDFRERFDYIVQLRRTESHTLWIQYRIRSTGEGESAGFGIDFDPLSVTNSSAR